MPLPSYALAHPLPLKSDVGVSRSAMPKVHQRLVHVSLECDADLESVYVNVVWADAVTANAKGRSTDNFIVRKFRKKILDIGIFAI